MRVNIWTALLGRSQPFMLYPELLCGSNNTHILTKHLKLKFGQKQYRRYTGLFHNNSCIMCYIMAIEATASLIYGYIMTSYN